jgi:superfamily I DNA/RNA helicase
MSLIEDLNLRSHFDSISKTREEYEDRVGNVMELVRAANRYDDDGPSLVISEEELESPLGNFLDDVALIADIAPDDEADDGNGRIVANLMTIHSSKGMEFDAVL